MTSSEHIDDRQVKELLVDLLRAPGRNQRRAREVVKRTGVEVKKGMRADFLESRNSGGPHGGKCGTYHPHIHRAISFDLYDNGYGVEIGVDKAGPQGGLGNILAFGTAHNGPIVDHEASMRRELPNALKHFGDGAEESVLGDRSQ